MIISKITVFFAPEINLKKKKHLVEWRSFESQYEFNSWEADNKVKQEYGDDYWSCYPKLIEDTKTGRLRDVQVKVKSYSVNELRLKPMSFFSSMPLAIFTKVQKYILAQEYMADSVKLMTSKSAKLNTRRPDETDISKIKFFDDE